MGLDSQEQGPGRGLWEEGRWDSLPKEAPSVGEKQIWGHMGSHGVRPRGPGRNVPVLEAAGLCGAGAWPGQGIGRPLPFCFPWAA